MDLRLKYIMFLDNKMLKEVHLPRRDILVARKDQVFPVESVIAVGR